MSARRLDRWLPAEVWQAPELRPRGQALVRVVLGSSAWLSAAAAGLLTAERTGAGLVLAASAVASLVLLPRLSRNADLPRCAGALAAILLWGSGLGAMASGGLASPLTWAGMGGGGLLTAYGYPRALISTLVVPSLLATVPDGMPGGSLDAPLEGLMTLATLVFVAFVATTLLAAERAARRGAKSRALLETSDLGVDRWELEGGRFLLEHAPVALFTLDPDGRLGQLRSPLARPLIGEGPPSEGGRRRSDLGDLLGWVARTGTPTEVEGARRALAAWRTGAPPEGVRRHLPKTVISPRGGVLELDWAPAIGSGERLERWVCAAREVDVPIEKPLAPSSGSSSQPLLEVLEPCLLDTEGVLQLEEDADVPVPVSIVESLRAAVSELLRNAEQAAEADVLRRERGKPETISVELRAHRRGRVLVLSVSDDGAGVDWAELERQAAQLGLPFGSGPERLQALARRGLSTRGRAGEGLARAAAGANGLGGALSLVASVEGEGAIFEVVLPLPLPERLRILGKPVEGRTARSGLS